MVHDSPTTNSAAVTPATGQAATRNWLIVLLTLGVGWRLLRYLLCFPFWGDEAYLNTSILHRDYAGLLEPLQYSQIAPLLYLWMQRTVFLVFGGGEYALRLSSLLAGSGALLLFWRFARRQLDPLTTTVAIGFFACSYYLVRHTCESKAYASDLFVATLLIWLAARWWEDPSSIKRGLLSTIATVLAVWFSYPAVFVACGVSLVMLVSALRRSDARTWILWLVYNALVAASFLVFWLVFLSIQSAYAADTWLEDYWRMSFPPRASIGAFLWWLVKIHTGRMFAYPQGGPNFASTLTTLLFLVGASALLIRRQGRLVLLFGGVALATMLAALMERYPYGGSVRVSIFFAPLICLIAAVGVTTFIDQLVPPGGRNFARGGVAVALVVLALVGITRDVLVPHKAPEDAYMRAVMRDVSQRFAPNDVVAVLNPEEGTPGPPDGPKFHQVLRYYLELYSPVAPTFRRGRALPAETDWLLRYTGRLGGPDDDRVGQLTRAAGLRLASRQSYPLSDRWPNELTVYRCTGPR
jgi:hypothetical protein